MPVKLRLVPIIFFWTPVVSDNDYVNQSQNQSIVLTIDWSISISGIVFKLTENESGLYC
jgi:hypothetical protein